MSKVNEMNWEGAMTEKDELFFRSVVDAYHACHESLRDTAKAMQLSRTKVMAASVCSATENSAVGAKP